MSKNKRHKKFSSIGKIIDPTNLYRTNRRIDTIILHCSASPQRGDDAHTIDRWHKERWGEKSGIGYHYLVTDDGSIQKGRWADNMGSHAKGYNSYSIGLCYTGHSILDCQEDSLRKLVDNLVSIYGLKNSDVIGHCEISNKTCPNLDLSKFRSELRQQ